ncbi:hypothetical protein GCU60_16320 [Blastococcus saxobsidens]|uniref:Uncharacterized protein n=1 Tax=Blastococcus saxobsidens TaxID=138336 RepID=A0A6L9W687_9ACTN|nr:hypothetical protein [Blastococcus saxobsidens]NEK87309.1 hypothetical protein [Blastococcus saxobsidens]
MNQPRSRSKKWRRRGPRAAPVDVVAPSAPAASGLARARSGLQRAALFLILILFPLILGLAFATGRNAGSDDVANRIAEKWGLLLPVILGIPAVVLLLAAWALRFLPGGREAAETAPLFRWNRGGGPKPVSVAAVVGIVALLLVGVGVAVQSYQGLRALSGAGLVLTVGEDTYVTRSEESSGRGGGLNYFLDTPAGEAIAEGDPADGDRYGVYPPDANRAWKISTGGWFIWLLTGLLSLGALVGAVFLIRAQAKRAAARRRWRRSRPRRTSALAVVWTTVAAVLATTAGAWVVADEATAGGTRTTLTIPGAAKYGLSPFWVRDGGTEHPYFASPDDGVAQPLRSRIANENRDYDLGLLDVFADVTVYPTAADAERAATLWLAEEADVVRDLYEGEGGELVLADGSSAVWNEKLTQITAATTRGEVLVTVEIDDWSYEETPEEVVARLQREAPEIRDLVADHSEEILDAELPWWG